MNCDTPVCCLEWILFLNGQITQLCRCSNIIQFSLLLDFPWCKVTGYECIFMFFLCSTVLRFKPSPLSLLGFGKVSHKLDWWKQELNHAAIKLICHTSLPRTAIDLDLQAFQKLEEDDAWSKLFCVTTNLLESLPKSLKQKIYKTKSTDPPTITNLFIIILI